MKKLLRIAVALCLVMCLSVTVFANSTMGATVSTATTSTGETVEVKETASAVTPTVAEAAAAVEVEGVKAEDLAVAWVRDLFVEIPEGGSVTITFDVPEAAEGQKVYVLHFNGTEWEKVGEGTGKVVEATFTSLSPVAIVIEKEAAAPVPDTGGDPAPAPGGDEPTSPQTGADMTLMYVGVAVFLAAGAVAIVAKKKNA